MIIPPVMESSVYLLINYLPAVLEWSLRNDSAAILIDIFIFLPSQKTIYCLK